MSRANGQSAIGGSAISLDRAAARDLLLRGGGGRRRDGGRVGRCKLALRGGRTRHGGGGGGQGPEQARGIDRDRDREAAEEEQLRSPVEHEAPARDRSDRRRAGRGRQADDSEELVRPAEDARTDGRGWPPGD